MLLQTIGNTITAIDELQYLKRIKCNLKLNITDGVWTYTFLQAGTPRISCWGSRSCRPAGREAVHGGTHRLLAAQDLQCTFAMRICLYCSCLAAWLEPGDCPRIAQCSTTLHAGVTSTRWARKKTKEINTLKYKYIINKQQHVYVVINGLLTMKKMHIYLYNFNT